MTNIYVGNLDFTVSEEQLRTLFAAYGGVETVTIVTDRDTGEPRGFAFVEMTRAGQAQDAICTLNGSVHCGRPLMVNEARPTARYLHVSQYQVRATASPLDSLNLSKKSSEK